MEDHPIIIDFLVRNPIFGWKSYEIVFFRCVCVCRVCAI